MLVRNRTARRRRGASMVENAIVITILLLFILGTVVLGLGVFRYQQVATLAREGARYASVHGSVYANENPSVTPNPVTAADIDAQIRSRAVGLDPAALQINVQMVTATGTPGWDASGGAVYSTITPPPPSGSGRQRNAVRVTVRYNWQPELFSFLNVPNLVVLESTSVMPMSY